MIKILIADDEDLECVALSEMIIKCIPDTEVLPFAATGVELMEKVSKFLPDIVVADIHMPRMNGLEALKKVRADFPEMKIIIVTAYGEFEYAQQALKLGSRDYILKPVQPDPFIQAVKSVVEEIKSEQKDERIKEEYRRKSEAYGPLVVENFLSNLVLGDLRTENIRRLQDLLRHPYYGGMVVTAALAEDGEGENKESAFFPVIKKVAEEIRLTDTCFSLEMRGQDVLCIFPEDEVKNEQDYCENLQRIIWHMIPSDFQQQCLFGIGRLKKSIRNLPESYREAVGELERMKSLEHISGGQEKADPLQMIFPACRRLMKEDNMLGVRQMILSALRKYSVDEASSLKRMRLVYFLYRLGQEHGGEFQDERIKQRGLSWGMINRKIGWEEAEQEPTEVDRILRYIRGGGTKGKSGNTAIDQSIQYMWEHYMEDLTLNRVAQHCHLNTSYFSRLFSQEIGYSFLDVLTDIRIEKGINLMINPQISIQEIGERTGYPNTNYFYKVFKKTAGVSVSEMREYVRIFEV